MSPSWPCGQRGRMMPVILGRAIRSSLGSRLGVSLSWLQLYAPDCASLYGTKVLGVPQLTSITRRLTGPYPPLAVAEEHNGTMTYLPAATRYDAIQYRRSGRSLSLIHISEPTRLG